jgi:tight adherence protein C
MSGPILISIGLFALLMAGISLYGWRRYAKPGKIYEQLGQPVIASGRGLLKDADKREEGAGVRMLRQIGERVPNSPADASELRRSLMMAGYRDDHAVTIFTGIRVVGTIVLVLVVLMLGLFRENILMRVLMLGMSGVMGWVGAGMVLERLIKARQERLRLSLPDALDLMVVSVEAGLGLDQAIQHVARELHLSHPEVSEEWGLVNLEMRAGKRRSEALRNLAERTGEPELRKLVAILVQNDRFGTSMAESLRAHSDFMRTRRRQDAEERAGKVGVKLVFPIFFFILPSMMVVTAGPGLLQVFKQLFPMMRNIG